MKRLIATIVAFNLAVLLVAGAACAAVWKFLPQPVPPVATLLICAGAGGAIFASLLQLLKSRIDP